MTTLLEQKQALEMAVKAAGFELEHRTRVMRTAVKMVRSYADDVESDIEQRGGWGAETALINLSGNAARHIVDAVRLADARQELARAEKAHEEWEQALTDEQRHQLTVEAEQSRAALLVAQEKNAKDRAKRDAAKRKAALRNWETNRIPDSPEKPGGGEKITSHRGCGYTIVQIRPMGARTLAVAMLDEGEDAGKFMGMILSTRYGYALKSAKGTFADPDEAKVAAFGRATRGY